MVVKRTVRLTRIRIVVLTEMLNRMAKDMVLMIIPAREINMDFIKTKPLKKTNHKRSKKTSHKRLKKISRKSLTRTGAKNKVIQLFNYESRFENIGAAFFIGPS